MITRYLKSPFWYGAGDSITGQVRKANEDNCGYRQTPNGELFVVCDGMGGHVGGATASQIAVDSIISYLSQQTWPDKPQAIAEALRFANTQILGTAANDASLKGMGTTACIVLCDGPDIWIGHVGDSRIYLFEKKTNYLHRITKDHSYVQALVDKGELDDREAENHPQKNIIMRALGSKDEVVPDVEQTPLHIAAGDAFLICSDGLSGMIDDNEIEAILSSKLSLEDKVDKLISEANAPGKGKDNITVQIIQALSGTVPQSTFPDHNPLWRRQIRLEQMNAVRRKKKMIVLISVLSVLLILLGIGLFFGLRYKEEIKDVFTHNATQMYAEDDDEAPKDDFGNIDEEQSEDMDSQREIFKDGDSYDQPSGTPAKSVAALQQEEQRRAQQRAQQRAQKENAIQPDTLAQQNDSLGALNDTTLVTVDSVLTKNDTIVAEPDTINTSDLR